MAADSTAVTLRPRRPSDDLAIAALSRHAFGVYAADGARAVRAMVRQPGARTEVATIHDEPVGVIIIRFAVSTRWSHPEPEADDAPTAVARLNAIAVRPDLRRCGLGRLLLTHAERLARRNGAVSLSLMTADSNAPARKLFESAGFLYLATIGGAYARREPALLMIKPLLSNNDQA